MIYPISLDTALQIVGSLKVKAINQKDETLNTSEKELLDQKIKMYLKEEKMLYGADEFARLSVMDKVIRLLQSSNQKIKWNYTKLKKSTTANDKVFLKGW